MNVDRATGCTARISVPFRPPPRYWPNAVFVVDSHYHRATSPQGSAFCPSAMGLP